MLTTPQINSCKPCRELGRRIGQSRLVPNPRGDLLLQCLKSGNDPWRVHGESSVVSCHPALERVAPGSSEDGPEKGSFRCRACGSRWVMTINPFTGQEGGAMQEIPPGFQVNFSHRGPWTSLVELAGERCRWEFSHNHLLLSFQVAPDRLSPELSEFMALHEISAGKNPLPVSLKATVKCCSSAAPVPSRGEAPVVSAGPCTPVPRERASAEWCESIAARLHEVAGRHDIPVWSYPWYLTTLGAYRLELGSVDFSFLVSQARLQIDEITLYSSHFYDETSLDGSYIVWLMELLMCTGTPAELSRSLVSGAVRSPRESPVLPLAEVDQRVLDWAGGKFPGAELGAWAQLVLGSPGLHLEHSLGGPGWGGVSSMQGSLEFLAGGTRGFPRCREHIIEDADQPAPMPHAKGIPPGNAPLQAAGSSTARIPGPGADRDGSPAVPAAGAPTSPIPGPVIPQEISPDGREPLESPPRAGYGYQVDEPVKGSFIGRFKDAIATWNFLQGARGRNDDIFAAIGRNDMESIQLFARDRSIVNRSVSGLTPLCKALFSDQREIIALLLAKGADIQFTDPSTGWTALHLAVRNDDVELVEYLLGRGMEVQKADRQGMTPLHFAVNARMAGILIQHGAPVDAKSVKEQTPLFLACLAGNRELAGLLVKHGASGDIYSAAASGDAEEVEKLLEGDRALARANRRGLTPLHCARTRQVAEMIISKGGDVKARDADGNTPLHLALSREVAELLMAKGAELNAMNNARETPLYRAHGTGNKEVEHAIRRMGGKV